MKSLIYILAIAIVTSCSGGLPTDGSKEETDLGQVSPEDGVEERDILIVSDLVDDPSLPPYEQQEIRYRYEWKLGKCLALLDDEEEGLNADHIGECGDMIGASIERDLTVIRMPGGNVSGADLSESKVDMFAFIFDEVVFDSETLFPEDLASPYTTAVNETERVLSIFKERINEGKASELEIINNQRRIKNALKEEDDEAKIEELILLYEESKKELERLQEINEAKRTKFDRHMERMQELEDLASDEEPTEDSNGQGNAYGRDRENPGRGNAYGRDKNK